MAFRRIVLLTFVAAAHLATAQTESPSTIAYQGFLSDGAGQPVADGDFPIQITLYDAVTGGAASYSETHLATVTDGVFSLLIGDGSSPSGPFSSETFDDQVWVEVTVAGTTMAPRTPLQAVPYARSLTPGARLEGDVAFGTTSLGAVLLAENTLATGLSYGLYGRSASSGGRGIFGFADAIAGTTYGVYGRIESPDGRGVYGLGSAPTGTAVGVYGETESSEGRGVYGLASAATGTASGVFGETTGTTGVSYGVRGLTSSDQGRGVYGEVTATSGLTYGLYGRSASSGGRGVFGLASAITGATYGVYGRIESPDGRGVYGLGSATTGTAAGVYGETESSEGRGVYGLASATSGTAVGIYGETGAADGRGVYGEATATTGDAHGVQGVSQSAEGAGLYGQALATSGLASGVFGETSSPAGYGLYGINQATTGQPIGIRGEASAPDGIGLFGVSASISGDGIGVYGAALSSDALAGFFEGGQGLLASSSNINPTLRARQNGGGAIIEGLVGTNRRFVVHNNGDVQADGTFTGGGADFAEWLPLASSSARPRAGDVVGVTAGHVGLATDGAQQVMVVSSNPAFVGNPTAAAGGVLIALVGQAEVRLASATEARVGDLLVASGRQDGTARAVSPARYAPSAHGPVVGRILELTARGTALALVGVDEAAALRSVVAEQQAIIESLSERLEAIERRLGAEVDEETSPLRP